MFKLWNVEWRFVGRLCGSVPQSRELIRPWLESRAPAKKPETGPSLDELEAEITETVDEIEERITLGFQRDGHGIFLWSGSVKAHLKDCAQQVAGLFKSKEDSNFRAKIANKVYPVHTRLYPVREDGSPIMEHDGELERPMHVMTRQGPRSALKRVRYLERPILRFVLASLDDGWLERRHLEAIMRYGAIHGYGGDRSLGEGRYVFTIEEASQVKDLRPLLEGAG